MTGKREQDHLERSLGLGAALGIGVGTMVGAGIFVFPGIAAGKAGPAAVLSFALGGIIAMLVALCTAELATAMPSSGGAYYFVSRAFGPFVGSLVGMSQWIGLIFSSAFYFVGFGRYALDILEEFNVSMEHPVILFALGAALFLLVVNLVGTKGVGKLQNSVVLVLVSLLLLLFVYGLLRSLGLSGSPQYPQGFVTQGWSPVFTTSALVFTSYLGFVQIATVAGEIRKPHINLPRALWGSVAIVTMLYVLAIYVSTSVLPIEKLESLGASALVEVSRSLVGKVGALVVMLSGLLATFSSANASILSSSRAVFALSKDRLLPDYLARIHQRFGTPYRAIWITVLPIMAFTLFDDLEQLAQVASLLHLGIYSMIAVTLLKLRTKRPRWYAPSFRAPAGKWLALAGGVACLLLMLFMDTMSQILALGLLAIAILTYIAWGRHAKINPPVPPHIIPALRNPRILLPVALPDKDGNPGSLLSIFQMMHLHLLGYHLVPEQTSPEQAQSRTGKEVEHSLEEFENRLPKGLNLERKEVVYTPDVSQSIRRMIDDGECNAVLLPKSDRQITSVAVYIQDEQQIDARLGTILLELTRQETLTVDLLIYDDQSDQEHQDHSLLLRQLEIAGVNLDHIRIKPAKTSSLIEEAKEIDNKEVLIMMLEKDAEDRDDFCKILDKYMQMGSIESPALFVLNMQRS